MILPHLDLANPDTYAAGMPYDAFRQLRHEEPVSWRVEPNGKGYWAVTRYADVLTVLKNPSLYSSWRGGALISDMPPPLLDKMRETMLHRDPPSHTAMKRLVNKAFTPRRVAELEEHIARRARALVDRVIARGTCDFVQEIAAEMPAYVICAILGVPVEDRQRLAALTARMLQQPKRDPQAAMQDTMAAVAEMRSYGAELGRRKRAEPGDDLVSDLLRNEEEGKKLTDGEFEGLFLLLFNAGSDTTKGLLSLGLHLLLDRPQDVERLHAEPTLLPTAIEEMLRYEAPLIQFRRTTTQPTQLGNREIAEGDKVVVFFPSANYDETVFAEPETFDIARTPNDHLSFGHGTHFCLGAPLARTEAKHVFREVLERMHDLRRETPLVTTRGNFVRGLESMRVRFRAA